MQRSRRGSHWERSGEARYTFTTEDRDTNEHYVGGNERQNVNRNMAGHLLNTAQSQQKQKEALEALVEKYETERICTNYSMQFLCMMVKTLISSNIMWEVTKESSNCLLQLDRDAAAK